MVCLFIHERLIGGWANLGSGYWTPSVYMREPGLTSGGSGRKFGQSVAIDGSWPSYTVAVGLPDYGVVHVVTVTGPASVGGEGTVSEARTVVCMEPCGPDATMTQYGVSVSVTSDGDGNRVVVVGSPADDGCDGGLITSFVGGTDGCANRGGVYVYEWSGGMYLGVAVYKGLATSGRVGHSVSSRRHAAAGVLVAVGSPDDDNSGPSYGEATTYTGGGIAAGAGHMLQRVMGSGTAWSVVHTMKPMHPHNLGPSAMGSSVDVAVQGVGWRAHYCAMGDGNARGGEHPAEYQEGENGSGALYIAT